MSKAGQTLLNGAKEEAIAKNFNYTNAEKASLKAALEETGKVKLPGQGNKEPQFSNKQSAQQWEKQFTERGWNKNSIQSTVDNPYTTRKATNRTTGNDATAYFNKDGSYVVIDNGTGKVVQISNKNNPNWTPDKSIIDPYIPGK